MNGFACLSQALNSKPRGCWDLGYAFGAPGHAPLLLLWLGDSNHSYASAVLLLTAKAYRILGSNAYLR